MCQSVGVLVSHGNVDVDCLRKYVGCRLWDCLWFLEFALSPEFLIIFKWELNCDGSGEKKTTTQMKEAQDAGGADNILYLDLSGSYGSRLIL